MGSEEVEKLEARIYLVMGIRRDVGAWGGFRWSVDEELGPDARKGEAD